MNTAVATKTESNNVVETTATSLMEVITRAASDPSVDVDKLERLMGLYERIEHSRSEREFSEAMTAAQAEMPQVIRDKDNDQTHSKYARLETLNKAIQPVVTKHGFSMSFGTADSPLQNHYRVTCVVSHTGGHTREYHADVPADTHGPKGQQNKTFTHGFGSAVSYGRRYLTLLIFNVATTEDDDGNGAGGYITQDQARELEQLIKETKTNLSKYLEHIGADCLPNIPLAKFGTAQKALLEKKAHQDRKAKGNKQ